MIKKFRQNGKLNSLNLFEEKKQPRAQILRYFLYESRNNNNCQTGMN